MTRSAALAILIGAALAIWLFATNDFGRIVATLLGAGWGILIVIALHLPQTLLSGLGWGALLDRGLRPNAAMLFQLRWVRESVNALLPVAQVGGDIVRVRLAAQRGVPPVAGTAVAIVDLSVEILAQAAFTLAGVGALLSIGHAGRVMPLAIGAVAGVALLAALFLGAQRFGLFRLIERIVARAVASGRWSGIGDLTGLHDTALRLYRQPRRIWLSGGEHLASWAFGVIETYAALRILGVEVNFGEALVIESLGQAIRAAGFLVPGALGVQEGGFVLVCALFGIPPESALALSLVRRVRELALGLPGLAWWRRMELRSKG